MKAKKKIIRMSTVPISLSIFCKDLLRDLSGEYEILAVSSPGEALDDLGKREGVRTAAVPMERRISLFKDFVHRILRSANRGKTGQKPAFQEAKRN